jgi:hypothetical protein
MSLSADALYKMSEVELLAAYAEARRQFAEKKFTRDTQRARLAWIKAKMFIGRRGSPPRSGVRVSSPKVLAKPNGCGIALQSQDLRFG